MKSLNEPNSVLDREKQTITRAPLSKGGIIFYANDSYDPELVQLLIGATSVNPESLEAWSAVKGVVTDPTKESLQEETARLLINNAGPVLATIENGELSKTIFAVIAEGCIDELSDCLPVLLETNVLVNLARFLVDGVDTASVICITDILIAAVSGYSASMENAELTALFNQYNLLVLGLLSVNNELAQTQLLKLSRMIVKCVGIPNQGDLERFFAKYFEFVAQESTTTTDNALHCILTVLRLWPDLYVGLIQREDMLKSLVYYLNVESIHSVKYASKILLPVLQKAASLPPAFVELVAKRIQEAIALSNSTVEYLMYDLVAICESSAENCQLVCSLGIFESEKLKGYSYATTKAMLAVYAAALKYNLLTHEPSFEPQIVTNVTDSLESPEEPVVLQALQILAALIPLHYPFDVIELLDELRAHENAGIAEHAAAIFSGLAV